MGVRFCSIRACERNPLVCEGNPVRVECVFSVQKALRQFNCPRLRRRTLGPTDTEIPLPVTKHGPILPTEAHTRESAPAVHNPSSHNGTGVTPREAAGTHRPSR